MFETTLQPMISDVMRGFEATIFAYGQTGTGKTYTMEGDVESEENQGVIPRALKDIFDRREAHDYQEFSVKVTQLETHHATPRHVTSYHATPTPTPTPTPTTTPTPIPTPKHIVRVHQ